LYRLMHQRLLLSRVIHSDDTSVSHWPGHNSI
jgi:hypothetical protein